MAPEPDQEQPAEQEPSEDVYSCSSGSSDRSTSSSEGFENIEAVECRESYDWSVQNVALESQPSWKPDHTLKVGAAAPRGWSAGWEQQLQQQQQPTETRTLWWQQKQQHQAHVCSQCMHTQQLKEGILLSTKHLWAMWSPHHPTAPSGSCTLPRAPLWQLGWFCRRWRAGSSTACQSTPGLSPLLPCAP